MAETYIPLAPCAKCGQPVKLRVIKMAFNRRPGVCQWLEHERKTDCDGTNGWVWHKFRSDKSKPSPFEQNRDRWNAHQVGGGDG